MLAFDTEKEIHVQHTDIDTATRYLTLCPHPRVTNRTASEMNTESQNLGITVSGP